MQTPVAIRHPTWSRHSVASVTRFKHASVFSGGWGITPLLTSRFRRKGECPTRVSHRMGQSCALVIMENALDTRHLRVFIQGEGTPLFAGFQIWGKPHLIRSTLPVSLHPPFYTRRNADSCCWPYQPRGCITRHLIWRATRRHPWLELSVLPFFRRVKHRPSSHLPLSPRKWVIYPDFQRRGAKLCLGVPHTGTSAAPSASTFSYEGEGAPLFVGFQIWGELHLIRPTLPVSLHPPFYTRRNADCCCDMSASGFCNPSPDMIAPLDGVRVSK